MTRELFTYTIENDRPETIEKAKREMADCASQMGFSGTNAFSVQPFHCRDTNKQKWRVEAVFST